MTRRHCVSALECQSRFIVQTDIHRPILAYATSSQLRIVMLQDSVHKPRSLIVLSTWILLLKPSGSFEMDGCEGRRR